MEGESEDIQITLSDGGMIYGQAKARTKNDPGDGSSRRFNEAMESLAEAYSGDEADVIMYVTNDEYPFGKNFKYSMFGDDSTFTYSELPSDVQKYIKLAASKNGLDESALSQFSVCVIGYYGDDDATRLRVVKKYIDQLISNLDILNKGRISFASLRNTWAVMLEENSSKLDLEIEIDKEQFIWPIIVNVCAVSEGDEFFADEDDDLVQDVISQYHATINSETVRFSFVTQVISDFEDFKSHSSLTKRSERHSAFVNEKWESYKDELGVADIESDVAEVLAKLTLHKILRRSFVIDKVKRGAGL